MEAVGGRVEADVDADRSRGQPGGEGLPVGRVLHEAAGLELGEEVHSGIMVPRRPRTGRPSRSPSPRPRANGDRGAVRRRRGAATQAAMTNRPGRAGADGAERIETATVANQHSVAEALEFQRKSSEAMGSALYGRLLAGLEADHAAGGLTTQLLEGRSERPIHEAVVLRLLGAAHRLVLEGRAPRAGALLPFRRRDRPGRPDAGVPRRGRRAPARGGGRDDPRRADQRGRAGRRAGARLRAHRPARAPTVADAGGRELGRAAVALGPVPLRRRRDRARRSVQPAGVRRRVGRPAAGPVGTGRRRRAPRLRRGARSTPSARTGG